MCDEEASTRAPGNIRGHYVGRTTGRYNSAGAGAGLIRRPRRHLRIGGFVTATKLVIIGGDAAGMSAAAQARRSAPNMEIVVFERSPYVSYAA